MAWLSFIELGKAVVHVIRLASFLCLWFQCVCPLMPSRNTYRLTWVSLTLGVGYLFTAAPAKCSRCSLPWTRGISSLPPFLTLNVKYLLLALLQLCSHRFLYVGFYHGFKDFKKSTITQWMFMPFHLSLTGGDSLRPHCGQRERWDYVWVICYHPHIELP